MPQCRVAGEAAALSVVETAGRACSVERPGAGSRSDLRARLERRVGPDHAVGTDLAQVGDGVLERGALPHRAVDQPAARTDLDPLADGGVIGRAHVCTPVTNAHLVCRLLLVNKHTTHTPTHT